MRYVTLMLMLCLLYSCDPYYHIRYSVNNQTTDTVYVKYMNYPDSLKVVSPGAVTLLKAESGIGFAKSKYKTKEFQDWFSKNSIVVKKTKENSIKKVSETKWKYEGHRINGDAIYYVKK